MGTLLGFFLLGLVVGTGNTGSVPAGLVIGAISAGGFWWVHSWLHPLVDCRGCKGRGGFRSGVWPRRSRLHAACRGRGRVPRYGHKVFRRAGMFSGEAQETGPGWGRVRRRSG